MQRRDIPSAPPDAPSGGRALSRLSRLRPGSLRAARARGFSLVELVMVITIVAIIATVGMSRFATASPFAGRAASDQLASALRSAQRLAVAQRGVLYVQVQADPPSLQVCRDVGCAQAVPPADGSSAWLATRGGTRLDGGASFSFDGMGRPSLAAAQDFTPRDERGQTSGPTVRVEAETGLVRLLLP